MDKNFDYIGYWNKQFNVQQVIGIIELVKFENKLDMGDIGNDIGIAVAQYFTDEVGWDKETLIDGIEHGISLIDGTH